VTDRPDVIMGVFCGATTIVAVAVAAAALLMPINRAAFWHGFVIAWALAGACVVAGGLVIVAVTKLRWV
jgi:hypothetical protein